MTHDLTSLANPRLKSLVALRKHRERVRAGLCLVEGREELTLALDAAADVTALYYCPELFSDPAAPDLVQRCRDRGVQCFSVSRAAFEKVSYRQGPDGLLGVATPPGIELDALELPADPLLLIVEAVEKPGNLGAMLRTADAAGVSAVIAVDAVTDWGNPNIIRASKGTVFSVPVISTELPELLAWTDRHTISIAAATPAADHLYTEVSLQGPLALAVGTEKYGLSDRLMNAADRLIRIPMAGHIDSLNVATSAAIVIYEAVRQRKPTARRT